MLATVHVETVVLLSQQKPDDTIEIDLDLDELDATSAETKATYQEIKDSSLIQALLKTQPLYDTQVSVSHTTRQPRPGEVHGEHYFFVNHDEFKEMISRDAFLEHAEVFGN